MIELLLLINSLRINPLELNSGISYVAQIRSDHLSSIEPEIRSHAGWTAQFKHLGCSYIGENIAWGFKNIKETNSALYNSDTHRNNMISENYQQIGIGITDDLVVELFCGI
jgi:uncharacterized protein YkwD